MTEEFPGVLGWIAEEVGPGAALDLARHFGGTEIYIPSHVGPGHRLAEALGLENARLVAGLVGRGDLAVPLGPISDTVQRKQAMERMIAAGRTDAEIHEKLGFHIQVVRRNRRRLKGDGGAA